MRYIKFWGGTPFCGTDYEEYEVFEDSITDDELDNISADKSTDNAASYEDLERDYSIDRDDYETEEAYEDALAEASEEYYAESSGGWEEVTEEEYNENK